METGAKIGIAVGGAIFLGGIIYFAFIRKTKLSPTDNTGGAGGQPAGASSAPTDTTPLEDKVKKAKGIALKVKCNAKTPPPRTKAAKIAEYKKCMLGADGYTWG